MKSDEKIDVTVIMAALNEEKNIISSINNTLKAFDNFNLGGEVVVVNDGSTDETQNLVSEMLKKDNRIKLINHAVNAGVGVSFWDGLKQARGTAVTTVPGDNENDAVEILRYFNLLEHVDIVIPFVVNKKARSLFRNLLSFLYLHILNLTFGVNFNYTNGAVLYRRSILSQIDHKSEGFFFQAENVIKLAKYGYLFAEVPYKLCTRGPEKSKAATWRSLFEVIIAYLKLFKDVYFGGYKKEIALDSLTKMRLYNE